MAPRLRASQVASTLNTYLTPVLVLVRSSATDLSSNTHVVSVPKPLDPGNRGTSHSVSWGIERNIPPLLPTYTN